MNGYGYSFAEDKVKSLKFAFWPFEKVDISQESDFELYSTLFCRFQQDMNVINTQLRVFKIFNLVLSW